MQGSRLIVEYFANGNGVELRHFPEFYVGVAYGSQPRKVVVSSPKVGCREVFAGFYERVVGNDAAPKVQSGRVAGYDVHASNHVTGV